MGLFKRKGRLSFNQRKRKYAREIKQKVEVQKNGKPYVNENGEVFPLTDTQLSFRSGYFTAIKDMLRLRKTRKVRKRSKTSNSKQKKQSK